MQWERRASEMLPATAGLTLTRACLASSSNRAAEGARAVGSSVHRGKMVGNVVEAWERRGVEELQGTRDPANFDDFRVRLSPCILACECLAIACCVCKIV